MKKTNIKVKKLNNFTAIILPLNNGFEWQIFNPKDKFVASGFGKNSKNAIDSARRRIKNESAFKTQSQNSKKE